MSQPFRRALATLSSAVLLVGVAPFLAGTANASHSIASVSPAGSPTNVTTDPVTISGSGFLVGAQVVLRRDADPTDQIAGTESSYSLTQIVATFVLTEAAPGAYDVVVSQVGLSGEHEAVCDQCFTVTSSPPTVTGIAPEPADAGELPGAFDLRVTGTNFARGMQVKFLLPGTSTVDTGLTFTPDFADNDFTTTTVDGTYAYSDGDFTPGLHDVQVINADGASDVCENCFQQPFIESASPAVVGAGTEDQTLTLSGAGFVPGTSVSFSNNFPTNITITNQVTTPTSITLTIDVAGNAPAGPRNVTVATPTGGRHTKAAAFAVSTPPSITSISPSALGQGATERNLTVNGSGFVNGVTFSFSPATGITVNATTFISSTEAQLNVSIAPTAPTGPRDVTVTNPDGGSSTTTVPRFTVNAGPTITSVSPSSLNRGQSGTVVIEGTNFSVTSGVAITLSSTGIVVTNIDVVDPTTVTATFSVANDAPGGLRQITVTNKSDWGAATCAAPGCFAVSTITASPGAGANTNAAMTITVSHASGAFGSNPTIQLISDVAGSAQPAISGIVTGQSSSEITATFNLVGAAPGPYSINVSTTAGPESCGGCFTVTGFDPTVTAVSPTTIGQGADNATLTLTGTNFARGAQVEFFRGVTEDTSITVVPGSLVFTSMTQISVAIDVGASTAPGPVTVRVTNTDGKDGNCTNCLTIDTAPTVAPNGVSPASRAQGSSVTVTIQGTGFDDGATADFGPGISLSNVDVTQGAPGQNDRLTALVTVSAGATLGPRTVYVVNEDGGRGACGGCFTVTEAPSIASVSPATGKPGESVNVTITGSNFASGMTNSSVTAGDGITVTNVSRTSPTTITAVFTVAATATAGPRDVTVVNADGGTGTKEDAFSVVAVPGPPTNVQAVPGDRSALVTWSAPASNGGSAITTYTVTCTPGCTSVVVNAPTTSATVTNLTNGTAYTFRVTATSAAGDSVPSAPSNAVVPNGPDGDLVPLTPNRILDTRLSTALGGGQTRTVKVTGGSTTVPASGVTAVVLNVTAVKPTAAGYLTVYPAGASRPNASTVNFVKGQVVPNLTKVKVGSGGNVNVYNSAGSTHVLFDVVGYFLDGTGIQGDEYVPLAPERLVDTRWGTGTTKAPLGSGEDRSVTLADGSPVPVSATAVIVNITVARPTAAGYLTAYPDGASRPNASTLNFVKGQTVPNLALVKLGPGGRIALYNSAGSTEVIVDVMGYYRSTPDAAKFKPIVPTRILDTRFGTGSVKAPISSGATRDVAVLGQAGVPSAGVTAVVVNVTVTQPTSAGYVTVFPSGTARPNASNVNFVKGQTVPNLAVVKVGSNGKVSVYNSAGSTHVLFDIVGYYV